MTCMIVFTHYVLNCAMLKLLIKITKKIQINHLLGCMYTFPNRMWW